jgi:hypothetical protein
LLLLLSSCLCPVATKTRNIFALLLTKHANKGEISENVEYFSSPD